MGKSTVQTSRGIVGDPHSSPQPSEIMREVVPTIPVPKPQLEKTSAEHKYQEYLSSHYDDHPSIITIAMASLQRMMQKSGNI